MVDALVIVDLVGIAIAFLSLIPLGLADKKYRMIPALCVASLMLAGIVLTVLRFVYGTRIVAMTTELSLLLTGVIVMTMITIAYKTGMLGLGDILTVLAVSLVAPYAPLGNYVRAFPAVIPLATVVAVIMIYFKMRKNTVVVEGFPPGFRRVCKRRAGELKRAEVVTEYPIYVEGAGFVYDKVFNGSPVENTAKILESVSDDTTVYTIPNFPFVYYFMLSYFITMGVTLFLGLMEVLGVVAP